MEYRRFGKTNWKVSQLSLGTVELGLDRYGIYSSGEKIERLSQDESVQLLLKAFERGVNLIDTAPTYASEDVIGAALKQWRGQHIYIATKVNRVDYDAVAGVKALKKTVKSSIEASLKHLGCDYLDLVQIHNATAGDMREGYVLEALFDAQQRGKVQYIGASVYGADAALEGLRHPEIISLQVAYNLLDQRMAEEVFAKAEAVDAAILVRSALLKGVLTNRYQELSDHLHKLRQAAEKALVWSELIGESLPQAAIRFCMSSPQVASVLLGVRNEEELSSGLDAASRPLLNNEQLREAANLAVDDEVLVDPRTWGIS